MAQPQKKETVKLEATVNNRARQFIPFNSLKGYYNLIKEKEKIKLKKSQVKKLTDDELNFILCSLSVGCFVKIIYLENGSLIQKEGIITKMDNLNKNITIIKQQIPFESIINIFK